MTYNKGTVRTRIQQKLDDTSFDTNKLDQFINDGQRDILNARRFVFMEDEADLTTTSGSTALTGLPTTMQSPLSIRTFTPIGNAYLLNYIEYEDLDRALPNPAIAGDTPPTAWTVFALSLIHI